MVDRVAYGVFRACVAGIRLLPLGVCFLLGRTLGLILWAILPGYRRLAMENIQKAFRQELSPHQVAKMARAHFLALGANGLCALKIPAMSPEAIARIATIEGLDHIRRAVHAGRGVLLAINHIGNWELYAQLVRAVPEARFGTVYQALRNPLVDAFINRDRQRLGVLTFDRKKGFHKALALVREPGVLGVLVDQHAGDGGLWVPLFGRLASTSTLAAQLAQRTGADLIPAAIYTAGFARWRVVVSECLPAASVAEVTASLNRTLEAQIRKSPPDWFWVHNRWKVPHPNFLITSNRRGVHLTPEAPPPEPFRILARSPNWLGDAVMSSPAVRAFKLSRPDARLTVLAPDKLAAFWEAQAEVDEVIGFSAGTGVLAVARRLRGRFDVAVLFPNSVRSALEVWLAGIPRRVGYAARWRRLFLNQTVRTKKSRGLPRPEHHADRYWRIAAACGAANRPPMSPQWAPPTGGPARIAVCPGAEYGPAKRWPAERFRETMRKVSELTPCQWVLVGSTGDARVAAEVCSGFPGSAKDLTGRTSLGELIETLMGCHALLTNDTGTMHLADALGVPLVAIFGSTEPALTGPRSPHSVILRHQVECSPCFLRECPLDFRCMKAITPEAAAAALRRLIAAPAPHPATNN